MAEADGVLAISERAWHLDDLVVVDRCQRERGPSRALSMELKKSAPSDGDARWESMTNHSLSRRAVLLGSTGLLWSCRSPSNRRAATSAIPGRPVPPPDTTPTVCQTTAPNIEGPFYKPGAPERAKLVLPQHDYTHLVGPPARALVVEGRIVDDRCRPVPGARLDVWQADHVGGYDQQGFGMRGRLRADGDGRYRFETLHPGRYLNGDRYRPAHIHVKVSARNHHLLTTQLYFPNDPYNEGDPFILPSLIMDLRDDRGRAELARFDFVLARI